MSELLEKNNPELDYESIVKEIREQVRRKIELGFYDAKEIGHIKGLHIEIPNPILGEIGTTPKTDKLEETFRFLDGNWDILARTEIQSPRKIVGPLVTLIKKFGFKLFRWVLGPLIQQQTRFNLENFLFLAELKAQVERMETNHANYLKEHREELIDLRNRYYQTSQRQLFLEKTSSRLDEQLTQFQTQFQTLSQRLFLFEDSIAFQKRKLDAILGKVQDVLDRKPEALERLASERDKLNQYDYTLFENIHRGSSGMIRQRQEVYLPFFKDKKNVLDIGCGRGEMLELFRENGIAARGIDLNDEMVRICSEKGLEAASADAAQYLGSVPDGSLGGLFSAQVIEHLPSDFLIHLVRLAYDKMEPGAPIALETINPQCLTTFCGSFYLDMTHIKPIHPQAIRFLLERVGFRDVRILYLTPYPEEMKLKKISLEGLEIPAGTEPQSSNGSSSGDGSGGDAGVGRWTGLVDLVSSFNENVDILNGILFSHQDYAVIARR